MNVKVFSPRASILSSNFALSLLIAGHLAGCGGSGSSGSSPVVKTTPTITWATPASVPAGTVLGSAQLDATASEPGSFVYTPAAGAVLSTVGTNTLSVSFTPTDTTDYNSASASVSITVTAVKATPTITWFTPASVPVGTVLGATQLDATASVAGAFVYSPAAGTALSTAGPVTLSVTFTPTDTTDYTSATDSVSLTVTAGPPPSYAWTNVKVVAGGYVTGLYFHPTTQNLMYARTDVGGAYRWGPNDTQWVPLLDWTTRSNWWQIGVEAIGLDPTNANNLYIAVGMYAAENWDGNGAMLVSTDQGNTFTTVPLPFKNGSNDNGRNTGERIAVDPNLPATVYFGTRLAGLQISTNSGAAWTQVIGLPVTTTNNGSGVVSVLPVQASGSSGTATPAIYAAVAGTGMSGDPVGLYVTTKGGSASSTFAPVSGQPSSVGAATPLAPLHAVLGPNGAIYVLYGDQQGPGSMNASQLWKFQPTVGTWTSGTWTRITLPNATLTIDNSNGYGGLAVDPSHAGVLLLGTLDQYWPTGDVIYRSSDDGTTWRDVSSLKNPGNPSMSPNLATHDDSLSPWLAFGETSPTEANGTPLNVSTGNWATSIVIDPFNSDHAMYGTGQTIWTTSNLTVADPSASSAGIVNWTVGANGVEETVVEELLAPPSGPTLLLSAMGDITGFAHQNLSVSPPRQMFTNPTSTPSSMDFEQDTPTTVVRATNGATPYGVISTNAGIAWTAFAAIPTGTAIGGGTIAIAPDGSSIVWATADTSSVWYSTNLGASWTAATGIPAQAQVVGDRIKPGVYYGYSGTSLYLSTNGGQTWTGVQSNLPSGGILVSLPDAQGDLFLAANGSGLYSNTGSASAPSLTQVSGVQDAYHVGFGAGVSGSAKPALYLDGQVAGVPGFYRSVDSGVTWVQINDTAHQWGQANAICGDMRTFGTVYIAAGARGIIWGTSAN
jgi:2-keto-3-deoxy-6-phosphogluconate aldolase